MRSTFVGDRGDVLTSTTVTLHWVIAIGMISNIALGLYCAYLDRGPVRSEWLDLHKSIGLTVLALAIVRILWRFRNRFPKALSPMPRWQRVAARATHCGLLIGTVVMPLSGIAITVFATLPIRYFGYEVIPQIYAHRDDAKLAHDLAEQIHMFGGYFLIACVSLHLAAALKHHFIDRDGTLRRMLGLSLPTAGS
jgi:cytochrome b561